MQSLSIGAASRISSAVLTLAAAVAAATGTASALAQSAKIAHDAGVMVGTDLPGSDLVDGIQLTAPPPGEFDIRQGRCAELCSLTKECMAWTYVRPGTTQGPNGVCWLKSRVPAKVGNAATVSGAIGEAGTDRPGGDYAHFDNLAGSAVTASLCKQACHDQASCRAWTFVLPNTVQGPKGVCWLKDRIASPVANDCCMSGYFDSPIR